jgi:hypothetical protein
MRVGRTVCTHIFGPLVISTVYIEFKEQNCDSTSLGEGSNR